MSTQVINGRIFEQQEIAGKGLCWVPVKTGIEQLEEYVKGLCDNTVTSNVNERFTFTWCGNKCRLVNVQLIRYGILHIGVLIDSSCVNIVETVFSVGLHDNWPSFIEALKREHVQVTKK